MGRNASCANSVSYMVVGLSESSNQIAGVDAFEPWGLSEARRLVWLAESATQLFR